MSRKYIKRLVSENGLIRFDFELVDCPDEEIVEHGTFKTEPWFRGGIYDGLIDCEKEEEEELNLKENRTDD